MKNSIIKRCSILFLTLVLSLLTFISFVPTKRNFSAYAEEQLLPSENSSFRFSGYSFLQEKEDLYRDVWSYDYFAGTQTDWYLNDVLQSSITMDEVSSFYNLNFVNNRSLIITSSLQLDSDITYLFYLSNYFSEYIRFSFYLTNDSSKIVTFNESGLYTFSPSVSGAYTFRINFFNYSYSLPFNSIEYLGTVCPVEVGFFLIHQEDLLNPVVSAGVASRSAYDATHNPIHSSEQDYFESYEYGYTMGYNEGYSVGFNDALETAQLDYDRGYNEGYNIASQRYYEEYFNGRYDLGYKEGFKEGVDEGAKISSPESYQKGRLEGYAEGYFVGEEIGFAAGYTEASKETGGGLTFYNLMASVIDAPIQAFAGLMNFEILGFNMSAFFTALLTACIIITILKIML